MLPKTLGSFGGPHLDIGPVENPQSCVPAATFDRLCEDVAQLTRVGVKAWCKFATVATGTATVSAGASQWGTSSSLWPAVVRQSTGIYVATYATSFTDALSASETVSFAAAMGHVLSTTVPANVQCTVSGNVVTLATFNYAGAQADITVGTNIAVWVY